MKPLRKIIPNQHGYTPKSAGEKKFAASHEIEEFPDQNGNGDEVFDASNVKQAEYKRAYDGNTDSYHEEEEYTEEDLHDAIMEGYYNQQLDEISASKLGRYINKAVIDREYKRDDAEMEAYNGAHVDAKNSLRKVRNREKGLNTALSKLTGGKNFTKTNPNTGSVVKTYVGYRKPKVGAVERRDARRF